MFHEKTPQRSKIKSNKQIYKETRKKLKISCISTKTYQMSYEEEQNAFDYDYDDNDSHDYYEKYDGEEGFFVSHGIYKTCSCFRNHGRPHLFYLCSELAFSHSYKTLLLFEKQGWFIEYDLLRLILQKDDVNKMNFTTAQSINRLYNTPHYFTQHCILCEYFHRSHKCIYFLIINGLTPCSKKCRAMYLYQKYIIQYYMHKLRRIYDLNEYMFHQNLFRLYSKRQTQKNSFLNIYNKRLFKKTFTPPVITFNDEILKLCISKLSVDIFQELLDYIN
jgi:hypothetical protein